MSNKTSTERPIPLEFTDQSYTYPNMTVPPKSLVEALMNDDPIQVYQHLAQNPQDLAHTRHYDRTYTYEPVGGVYKNISLLVDAYNLIRPQPIKSIIAIIDFSINYKHLLDSDDIFYTEYTKILKVAIDNNQEEIAIKLVEAIKDYNSKSFNELLNEAFCNKKFNLVKAFIKNGADPNWFDNKYKLSVAVAFAQDEIAKKNPNCLVEIIEFNKFVGKVDILPTQWLVELTKRLYNTITFYHSDEPKEFLRLITTLEQYEKLILTKLLTDLVNWQKQNSNNGLSSSVQTQYVKLTQAIEKLKSNNFNEASLSPQDFPSVLQEFVVSVANVQLRRQKIDAFYKSFETNFRDFSSKNSRTSVTIWEGGWRSGKSTHLTSIQKELSKYNYSSGMNNFTFQFCTYLTIFSLYKEAMENNTSSYRHPSTQKYYEDELLSLQSFIGPSRLSSLTFTEVTVPNSLGVPLSEFYPPSAPILTTPFGTSLSPELHATALLTYSQKLGEYATTILNSTKAPNTLFPISNPYLTNTNLQNVSQTPNVIDNANQKQTVINNVKIVTTENYVPASQPAVEVIVQKPETVPSTSMRYHHRYQHKMLKLHAANQTNPVSNNGNQAYFDGQAYKSELMQSVSSEPPKNVEQVNPESEQTLTTKVDDKPKNNTEVNEETTPMDVDEELANLPAPVGKSSGKSELPKKNPSTEKRAEQDNNSRQAAFAQ